MVKSTAAANDLHKGEKLKILKSETSNFFMVKQNRGRGGGGGGGEE